MNAPLSTVMQRRWLESLIRDAQVIEVRVDQGPMVRPRWISGYFNSVDAINLEIDRRQGQNLYSTFNRPTTRTVTNRIVAGVRALTDTDIVKWNRLFFDFDPERRSGTPATDFELHQASDKAQRFIEYLGAFGFPRPAIGKSGNGIHVFYRVAISEVGILHTYLQRLYPALSERFSNDFVTLDATVRNPAQLTRLYGSTNVKGSAGPDTPHRRADIWMPEDYRPVSARRLWSLICAQGARKQPERPRQPPRAPGRGTGSPATAKGDFRTLDVVGWLRAHGLYRFHVKDSKHAVYCPWRTEHTGGDAKDSPTSTVVWEPRDGKMPVFKCSHAHCADRGLFDLVGELTGVDDYCSDTFRRQGA